MTAMNTDSLDGVLRGHADVIEEYRQWLGGFLPHHAERWEQRLKSSPESAIVEAGVWRLLRNSVETIEPNEDASHGGPDFRCWKNGQKFYVEVTGINIETATATT